MKKGIFSIILFFLLGLFPAVGMGQGLPHRRGWGPPPGMEDWVRQLNLTEEQATKIRNLRETFQQETMPLRDELLVKRFRLRELFMNPRVDAQEILAAQREISEMESKLQERAMILQLDIRKILTPEQLKLMPPGLGVEPSLRPGMMPGRIKGMGRP